MPLGDYGRPAEVAKFGNVTELSPEAARDIPNAKRAVIMIPDCGHIPHLEFPAAFLAEWLPFLQQ
ncbi:MAG: alpha/beta hydrolase [Candidatus Cybelea sp.]